MVNDAYVFFYGGAELHCLQKLCFGDHQHMAIAQATNAGSAHVIAGLEQCSLSNMSTRSVDTLENHLLTTGLFEHLQRAIDQHIHFFAGVAFGKEQMAGHDCSQFATSRNEFAVGVTQRSEKLAVRKDIGQIWISTRFCHCNVM